MTINATVQPAGKNLRFVFWARTVIATALTALFLSPAPAVAQSAGGGLSQVLELRGYTEIGGVYAFSIFNTETGRGHWLWLNEPSDGYLVTNFNPEQRTVEIRYNSQMATISLQRSRILEYLPDISPGPAYVPSTLPPGQEPRGAGNSGAGGPAPQNGATSEEAPPAGELPEEYGPVNGGVPFGGGANTTTPDSSPDDEDDESEDTDPSDPGSPPPPPPTPPPGYTPQR